MISVRVACSSLRCSRAASHCPAASSSSASSSSKSSLFSADLDQSRVISSNSAAARAAARTASTRPRSPRPAPPSPASRRSTSSLRAPEQREEDPGEGGGKAPNGWCGPPTRLVARLLPRPHLPRLLEPLPQRRVVQVGRGARGGRDERRRLFDLRGTSWTRRGHVADVSWASAARFSTLSSRDCSTSVPRLATVATSGSHLGTPRHISAHPGSARLIPAHLAPDHDSVWRLVARAEAAVRLQDMSRTCHGQVAQRRRPRWPSAALTERHSKPAPSSSISRRTA